MTPVDAEVNELERFFAQNLLSRRQFAAALLALGVSASRLNMLGESVAEAATEVTTAQTAPGNRNLVVIVMDGFRPDYARLAPMHHLRALMARGMTYENAWVGHMESETPTGHATIATGVYPRKHSVVGFGWRDTSRDVFTYLPTDLRQINGGRLAQTIAGGGVPTISDLIHARKHNDVTVSLSGEKYYASASMGSGANYIFYGHDDAKGVFRPIAIGPTRPPPTRDFGSITGDSAFELQDHFAASLAAELARRLRPRALFVNLPGADIAGHYYGGIIAPHDMSATIRATDWAIGRIMREYEQLGLMGKTVFVVTADHGMSANRHIVPIHSMYNSVTASGTSYLDEEYRITAGSIWLRDVVQAKSLASNLVARHFPGVEGAFYKVPSQSGWSFVPESATASRLPRDLLHAYVNLVNTEACAAGPEVVLPYSEDTTGLTMRGRKHWGNHGGFSWGVQHIPLVIAGPGVRSGVSSFPAKLVDVAPTVERLLGLAIPRGVDGTILADALLDSSRFEQTAQRAVQDERATDMQVLRAHSVAQSR